MGFNWQGAVGGLLGEMGTQATGFADRKVALEQKRIERAIEERKEAAKLAKEEAMMKDKYYREDAKDERDQKRLDAMATRDDKRYEAQAKRDEAREAAAERRHAESMRNGGEKSSADEKKLRMIENDPNLTPEEKAAARKALYGIDKGGKGGLTDYQMMQAENKLVEIEGAGVEDEATAAQANAIRRRLGMPELKKVEKEALRGGILGIGSKDPVYEYVEDYEGMGAADKPAENAEGKPVENKPAENKGGSLLDQVDKILPPAGAKAATKPVEEEKPAGTGKSMSADLGSVLGTIVKGGVGAVQKLAAGGQDLMELDRQLTAASQTAHGESKSALLKALAAVRQVMAAETNPEAELRSRAIAPNQ